MVSMMQAVSQKNAPWEAQILSNLHAVELWSANEKNALIDYIMFLQLGVIVYVWIIKGKGVAVDSVWKLLSHASVNNEAFLGNGVQILWEVKTPSSREAICFPPWND